MSDVEPIRSSIMERELVEQALGKFGTYGHSAGALITPAEATAMAARITRLEEERDAILHARVVRLAGTIS